MTNTFDITTFGAVGDGVTDCTESIQKALDKAGEVSGCVVVPPGIYMTGQLHMHAFTRLEGKAAWSFRADGLSVLRLKDGNQKCLLDVTGAFGASISGICMDGGLLGENTHGVSLCWEKYNGGGTEDTLTIDDCRIGKFSGDGLHLEHIWCFSVRHSMLHHNGGSGMYIDGWDGFLMDNQISGNCRSGILGGPCIAAITITGNRVEWNAQSGFRFVAGRNINVTGNYFDRSFGPGLWIGGGENNLFEDGSVTGNVFFRNGSPDKAIFASEYESSHIFLSHASNLTVTGNSFRVGVGDEGKGSMSPAYGIAVQNSGHIIVQSNVMHDCSTKQGIVWDQIGKCLIRDNME